MATVWELVPSTPQLWRQGLILALGSKKLLLGQILRSGSKLTNFVRVQKVQQNMCAKGFAFVQQPPSTHVRNHKISRLYPHSYNLNTTPEGQHYGTKQNNIPGHEAEPRLKRSTITIYISKHDSEACEKASFKNASQHH